MSKLNNFDVVLQVAELSLNRVIQNEHKRNFFPHFKQLEVNGYTYEIVLNCPNLTIAQENPFTAESVPLTMTLKLIINRHDSTNPRDPGDNFVVDVVIPEKIYFSPTELVIDVNNATVFHIDWSGMSTTNISIPAVTNPAIQSEISTFILQSLIDQSGSGIAIPVPSIETDTVTFTKAGLYALPHMLEVGLSSNPAFSTNRFNIMAVDNFLEGFEWALGLSSDFIQRLIRSIFMDREHIDLNNLPARLATNQCVPDPMHCREKITVDLHELTFTLVPNTHYIATKGKIHINNSNPLLADFYLHFSPRICLTLQPNGKFRVDFGPLDLYTHNNMGKIDFWVAKNIFHQQVKAIIADMITSKLILMSNAIVNYLNNVLLQDVLVVFYRNILKNPFKEDHVNLAGVPLYQAFNITSDGVFLHGAVHHDWIDETPIASFTSLATSNPLEVILNAKNSWVPGGVIKRYIWTHSDGTEDIFSDNSAKFVLDKTFKTEVEGAPYTAGVQAPGESCLTVEAEGTSITNIKKCQKTIPVPYIRLNIDPRNTYGNINGIPIVPGSFTLHTEMISHTMSLKVKLEDLGILPIFDIFDTEPSNLFNPEDLKNEFVINNLSAPQEIIFQVNSNELPLENVSLKVLDKNKKVLNSYESDKNGSIPIILHPDQFDLVESAVSSTGFIQLVAEKEGYISSTTTIRLVDNKNKEKLLTPVLQKFDQIKHDFGVLLESTDQKEELLESKNKIKLLYEELTTSSQLINVLINSDDFSLFYPFYKIDSGKDKQVKLEELMSKVVDSLVEIEKEIQSLKSHEIIA